MKRVGFAVVLGAVLSSGTPALADDHMMANVAWKSAPSRADVDAAFPKDAVGHVTGANVYLRCQMRPDGTLIDCKPIVETPGGLDFAVAARSLTSHFVAYVPPEVAEAKGRVFVNLHFIFHDPGHRADPVEFVDVDLLQRSDAAPPANPFPDAAAKAGYLSGLGVVDCDGRHGAVLVGCVMVSEAPDGLGFGQAAVTTAEAMALNPWQDGEPVEGARLRLPIYVDAPGALTDPAFKRKAIFHVAKGWPGTAGPYFPDRAVRMNVSGSAVIQCVVSASGSLSDCVPISESATDMGFTPASLLMAFQGAITVAPRLVAGRPIAGEAVQVEVPFVLSR